MDIITDTSMLQPNFYYYSMLHEGIWTSKRVTNVGSHDYQLWNLLRKYIFAPLFLLACILLTSCNAEDNEVNIEGIGTDIVKFALISQKGERYEAFQIQDSLIRVQVPKNCDLKQLRAEYSHNGNYVVVNGQRDNDMINLDFSDPTNPINYTCYSTDGSCQNYQVQIFNLPVVYLNTIDKKSIVDRDNYIPANILFIDNNSELGIDKSVSVKGRGNSSWKWTKKGYSLKFETKESVLGMPKSKKWVLLGHTSDWTCIRTPFCFKLSENADFTWSPSGYNVELILNDTLRGNYYLCEQIKAEKNRINIQEMTPADTLGEALTGGAF